jgi:hypothetical protein
MFINTGVALRPDNEAPRRSGRTERGTANFINNDADDNTASALRLQRLRLIGVIGERANLLAGLAWGEARHG